MWGSIVLMALALGGQGVETRAPSSASPQAPPVADARPILFRTLRSGMSPAEVQAALTAERVRARLLTDTKTGRQYVEAQAPTQEAGRQIDLAFGFVNNGLFFVDVSWMRQGGRVRFDRSRFMGLAGELAQRFGPPVSIDPDYRVSDMNEVGVSTTARARFEQGGVRADMTGQTTLWPGNPPVIEVVDVRFWRIADAAAFNADERRRAAAAGEGREGEGGPGSRPE